MSAPVEISPRSVEKGELIPKEEGSVNLKGRLKGREVKFWPSSWGDGAEVAQSGASACVNAVCGCLLVTGLVVGGIVYATANSGCERDPEDCNHSALDAGYYTMVVCGGILAAQCALVCCCACCILGVGTCAAASD